jgi:type IV pilus assembly protein PilV
MGALKMRFAHSQRGTSLLEVLVTVVIISIGLLGLAGLQSRMQISQIESYQRSQALVLLDDMANRIAANRHDAANYVTDAAQPLGAGISCPTTGSGATRQTIDASQWCTALQGASETLGGANAGAMLGGRGCVESISTNEYLVSVAWQGQAPVSAPPASVTCATALYDDGVKCISDRCRRVVTTVVRIAAL